MAQCVVLLGRSPALTPLRERLQRATDIALIDVLDTMPTPEPLGSHKPALLIIGQAVAWSGAGWEFIERFRVLSPDTEIRVLPENEPTMAKLLHGAPEVHVAGQLAVASFPLPRVPSRRSVRRPMPTGTTATVNGRNALLIDISPFGAQVLTPLLLKPGQRVSFGLRDRTEKRVRGSVAWSLYELQGPGGSPHYRVGLAFDAQLSIDEQ